MQFRLLLTTALAGLASLATAQTRTSNRNTTPAPTNTRTPSATATSSRTTSGGSVGASPAPPDVVLNVPELSVGRIELAIENLKADINLAANVASLVSINAGVALSLEKVNLTIVDVRAELDLVVRLGHLVDIVNRVFESLDLNPILISAINGVTDLLGTVVGAVDGLLGSITQGNTKLSFLIDNLGNIVQEVTQGAGEAVHSIVGNYKTNMTQIGEEKKLGNGLVQKQFSYSPLNSIVNIVFNAAGQVVQAAVAKPSGGGGSATSSGTVLPTSTPAPTSSK